MDGEPGLISLSSALNSLATAAGLPEGSSVDMIREQIERLSILAGSVPDLRMQIARLENPEPRDVVYLAPEVNLAFDRLVAEAEKEGKPGFRGMAFQEQHERLMALAMARDGPNLNHVEKGVLILGTDPFQETVEDLNILSQILDICSESCTCGAVSRALSSIDDSTA